MKIYSGRSAGNASGTLSLPQNGGASGAAVFAPALVIAALLLGGCGKSTSTLTNAADDVDVAQQQIDQPASDLTLDDESSSEGDTDNSADSGFSSTGETGADVLLVQPAGRSDLPTTQTPDLKFKPLDDPTLESAATSRSRIALTADGGRSTSTTAGSAATGNVTISWDPPSENADGTSISDLAGYRVYQGNQEQLSIVQEINETGAGERRLTQVTNVSVANACFAVTAFDTSANESALGDVVCKDTIVATPPVNNQAPNLSEVSQLASSDGQAEIQLTWQPPATSSAGAGANLELYNVYHGSQSQLFKIEEVTDAAANNGSVRRHTISGITGDQACFALTASYSDGTESSLGEIVCVALVHSARPEPGDQLRPYNIAVDLIGTNQARVGWDKPNTVVSSGSATGIDRYDVYQGSRSQVYKVGEIEESGAAGTRRTTIVDNVFDGSHCFALTATDNSRRQSALSTIVCAALSTGSGSNPTPPPSGTIGVLNVTVQETSPGSIAIAWDTPELVAAGQPISNLSGYNLYQGSTTQLFKVAEIGHNSQTTRQQAQRTNVAANNACFALTAYDRNGFEAPLSQIVCGNVSGGANTPQIGIVPPTDLATRALGGSTTITLSWLSSGAALTGAADPNVSRYNIYQGNHDRLFKVREVREEHDGDPRNATQFTGVAPDSACFAMTAQYSDLRESQLSEIVCRDN